MTLIKFIALREFVWFILVGILFGSACHSVISQGYHFHFWVMLIIALVWTFSVYFIARHTRRRMKEIDKACEEIDAKLNFYQSLGAIKRVRDDEDGKK